MLTKLKDAGLFDRKILIGAGVLLLLVGITVWALWDAENTDPIAEDSKGALEEESKKDKEDREKIKKDVGKEYPSLEEVERFVKTIPSDVYPVTVLEKEFGKEVTDMFYSGELISRSDDATVTAIKTSEMKRTNDKNAVQSTMDLINGGVVIPTAPYTSKEEGFGDVGKYKVGYVTTTQRVWGDKGTSVREDGYIAHYLQVSAYALEEMTAEEFQKGFNELGIKVDGVDALPAMERERKEGDTKLPLPGGELDMNGKEYKDVNSMVRAGDWQNTKFSKSIVYPGTVVQMSYEIPMTDIYKEATYNAETDSFTGEPKELTVTVGNYTMTVQLIQGGEPDLNILR